MPDTREMIAGVTLSVVGIATFLLMPPFVEAAVSDLKFSEQQVGIVSAALASGTTVASIGAGWWIRRSAWRGVGGLALFVMLGANALAMRETAFLPFTLLQAVVGLCSGSLYSLALTVLSDCRQSDRYFAFAIGAQTIYQILGLVAGPWLIGHGGMNAMLLTFIAMTLLGFAMLPLLPAHGRDATQAGPGGSGRLWSGPVILSLCGCFLFYVNIGAYWTYIERIGVAATIDLATVSNALALATATSMAGVVLASWLGARRGYLLPIGLSALAIVYAMVLLTGAISVGAYAASAIIYGIAWNVSMTYQYGTVNVVDRSRRGVALAPAFHNAGNAAGPAVAAFTVSATDHRGVLWLVAGSVLFSLICFRGALRRVR